MVAQTLITTSLNHSTSLLTSLTLEPLIHPLHRHQDGLFKTFAQRLYIAPHSLNHFKEVIGDAPGVPQLKARGKIEQPKESQPGHGHFSSL